MKVEMSDYAFYETEVPTAEMLCFDLPFRPPSAERGSSADSVPHPHTENSNCGSEHILSSSPDLSDRDHADSQPLHDGWFDDVIDRGGSANGDFFLLAANRLFGMPLSSTSRRHCRLPTPWPPCGSASCRDEAGTTHLNGSCTGTCVWLQAVNAQSCFH
jgi:hypothetical protein